MAFTVKFWKFAKKEKSTKIPSATGSSYQCTLKNGCDMMAPEIELQVTATTTPLYNYAYIANFGRYYRVSDWRWEDRLWTAKLYVDVFASNKTAIGNSEQYVLRAASTFNGFIRDDMYPPTADVTSSVILATDPNYWWQLPNDPDSTSLTSTDATVIVGVISSNGIDYLAMPSGTFTAFCNNVLNLSATDFFTSGIEITWNLGKLIFDPFEYITSVLYVPVSIARLMTAGCVGTSTANWNVGWWSLTNTGVSVYPVYKGKSFTYTKTFNLPSHPKAATRGVYLNALPYTELFAHLPRVGPVPIDTSLTADCDTVTVDLNIDLVSGEAVYNIKASKTGFTYSIPLGRYSAQLGVTIQLSQNAMTLSNLIDNAASIYSNMAATTTSPVCALGALSGVARFFEPHLSTVGNSGGYMELQNGECILTAVFRDVADADLVELGAPLCQAKTISTLSGYIKCLDANLEIDSVFDQELKEIVDGMNSGFYYE